MGVEGDDIDGEVRINHTVIANIIRLSVLEVDGVANIVGSFFGGVAELFFKKDTERGITVREDECGRYIIGVRVAVYFGVPLTEVAAKIQKNVSSQVYYMTQKDVARVDVTIDGVKVHSAAKQLSVVAKENGNCG
ncbi:MAG: Asp23/Gls24 family envelope stress response protein [Puniceicoccales bacterium]|jgi:uncharacterized alkaline shock family protein YloU|nr:Asp23/Gls24 family envelope stress response protein [Puniceicoccales bacterium]